MDIPTISVRSSLCWVTAYSNQKSFLLCWIQYNNHQNVYKHSILFFRSSEQQQSSKQKQDTNSTHKIEDTTGALFQSPSQEQWNLISYDELDEHEHSRKKNSHFENAWLDSTESGIAAMEPAVQSAYKFVKFRNFCMQNSTGICSKQSLFLLHLQQLQLLFLFSRSRGWFKQSDRKAQQRHPEKKKHHFNKSKPQQIPITCPEVKRRTIPSIKTTNQCDTTKCSSEMLQQHNQRQYYNVSRKKTLQLQIFSWKFLQSFLQIFVIFTVIPYVSAGEFFLHIFSRLINLFNGGNARESFYIHLYDFLVKMYSICKIYKPNVYKSFGLESKI